MYTLIILTTKLEVPEVQNKSLKSKHDRKNRFVMNIFWHKFPIFNHGLNEFQTL